MPAHQLPKHAKGQSGLPTARGIRRACSKELYRARKRLKLYIAPELVHKGEELYCQKVGANLLWISENHSNRKALCDWWDTEVSQELAELWEVDKTQLCAAFRQSFGG